MMKSRAKNDHNSLDAVPGTLKHGAAGDEFAHGQQPSQGAHANLVRPGLPAGFTWIFHLPGL